MLTTTADIVLPTSIIGSLPRPSWYTENLRGRNFLHAMLDTKYREQYIDAVTVFLRAQEAAGVEPPGLQDVHLRRVVVDRVEPPQGLTAGQN